MNFMAGEDEESDSKWVAEKATVEWSFSFFLHFFLSFFLFSFIFLVLLFMRCMPVGLAQSCLITAAC